MFIITPKFKFLDVMNYLAPLLQARPTTSGLRPTGVSKPSHGFHEGFDSPDKLAYPSLPEYPACYSRQKAAYPLMLQEWQTCKQVFHTSGMTSFADWPRYYNNLDVGPFIEALQKMKVFYGERGIDICNDAISLTGVALQYLLRGTAKEKLYAPTKEAYIHLKTAVSGGPSIVFT